MTFRITLDGTPGLAFSAHISATQDWERGVTSEEVAGFVPVKATADGASVVVSARITSGAGELTVTVARGVIARSGVIRAPGALLVVSAFQPRRPHTHMRTTRSTMRDRGFPVRQRPGERPD